MITITPLAVTRGSTVGVKVTRRPYGPRQPRSRASGQGPGQRRETRRAVADLSLAADATRCLERSNSVPRVVDRLRAARRPDPLRFSDRRRPRSRPAPLPERARCGRTVADDNLQRSPRAPTTHADRDGVARGVGARQTNEAGDVVDQRAAVLDDQITGQQTRGGGGSSRRDRLHDRACRPGAARISRSVPEPHAEPAAV